MEVASLLNPHLVDPTPIGSTVRGEIRKPMFRQFRAQRLSRSSRMWIDSRKLWGKSPIQQASDRPQDEENESAKTPMSLSDDDPDGGGDLSEEKPESLLVDKVEEL